MATTSPIVLFLQSIFTSVKAGLAKDAIPPALTFLQNTTGLNPLSMSDDLKYIAQLDLLRSSLVANLTSSAPAELQAIDATISNELQVALQSALAKATVPVSSTGPIPAPGTGVVG